MWKCIVFAFRHCHMYFFMYICLNTVLWKYFALYSLPITHFHASMMYVQTFWYCTTLRTCSKDPETSLYGLSLWKNRRTGDITIWKALPLLYMQLCLSISFSIQWWRVNSLREIRKIATESHQQGVCRHDTVLQRTGSHRSRGSRAHNPKWPFFIASSTRVDSELLISTNMGK